MLRGHQGAATPCSVDTTQVALPPPPASRPTFTLSREAWVTLSNTLTKNKASLRKQRDLVQKILCSKK